jgi:hypothetical protein
MLSLAELASKHIQIYGLVLFFASLRCERSVITKSPWILDLGSGPQRFYFEGRAADGAGITGGRHDISSEQNFFR